MFNSWKWHSIYAYGYFIASIRPSSAYLLIVYKEPPFVAFMDEMDGFMWLRAILISSTVQKLLQCNPLHIMLPLTDITRPPLPPIPRNLSLGCIWCALGSIVLYMATTCGWNHLNRSLLCHHPKMSSLFYRLCLISEQISPLHPSASALTAFNALDLSSLMGRRTRGATCGRQHHPNLKWRVCPGTLARTYKSASWDQCSIFSNQKTPASSFGTSLSDAKRRSRSLDANVVQRSS